MGLFELFLALGLLMGIGIAIILFILGVAYFFELLFLVD